MTPAELQAAMAPSVSVPDPAAMSNAYRPITRGRRRRRYSDTHWRARLASMLRAASEWLNPLEGR